MILYTTASNDRDLHGILDLQRANLPGQLSKEELEREGFVTVVHSLEDLRKLNRMECHVIAKEQDKVIAYLLAMTVQSKDDIPILVPMFEEFEKIWFDGRRITRYHFIVVGQVCVAKDFRGKGVLGNAYAKYKEEFQHRYDFAITEIAVANQRSLNAHRRIGFREIHTYNSPDNTEWRVVLWDWQNPG